MDHAFHCSVRRWLRWRMRGKKICWRWYSHQSSSLVIGCLHACDNRGIVVVGVAFVFLPLLMIAKVISVNILLAQFSKARVPQVIRSILGLRQTFPNHRHTLLLLLWYEPYHLQSQQLMDPFDVRTGDRLLAPWDNQWNVVVVFFYIRCFFFSLKRYGG